MAVRLDPKMPEARLALERLRSQHPLLPALPEPRPKSAGPISAS